MKPANDNLPDYGEKDDAAYLMKGQVKEKVLTFLRENTIKDDGGITCQVDETGQGLVVKRII